MAIIPQDYEYCISYRPKQGITVISGLLPASSLLIFQQTVFGAGYRKGQVLWSFLKLLV